MPVKRPWHQRFLASVPLMPDWLWALTLLLLVLGLGMVLGYVLALALHMR